MKVISALLLLPTFSSAFVRPLVMPAVTTSITGRARSGNVALATSSSPVMDRSATSEVVDLFNHQITNELKASQLYLSASIWCDDHDLVGMADFMLGESHEERGHAMKFIEFANKRNFPIKLETIPAPDASWQSPEQLWEEILNAEAENTQAILKLGDAASKADDHALSTFLMPFHMEQVDSEDNLRRILAKVKDESKTPGLIRQLDTELGQQVAKQDD